MERSIEDILADLFAAIENADYGIEGNGQGYDVKIYGVPELKELLANLGLIVPESSYTLAAVHAAVAGFYYNASSNFATLQTDILTTIEALIVENSPVIDGGDAAAFTIDENTTDVATITASDPQGDALIYSLSGDDADRFQIDAAGALSFINAPDFEAPADAGGDNVYDVTVTVSDGAQSDSQDIAVTVGDVNEAPVIDGGDTAAFGIDENTTAVATISASDPEGDALTYSLSGEDALLFEIGAAGALSFINAPDFEAPADTGGDNIYDVTVTVSDGAQSDSQDIAVTVEDKTLVMVGFDPGNVTKDGTALNVFSNYLNQAVSLVENGFKFTAFGEGDGLDGFLYVVNNTGILGYSPPEKITSRLIPELGSKGQMAGHSISAVSQFSGMPGPKLCMSPHTTQPALQ